MITIYEVYVETENPSQNFSGTFDDISEMNKAIDRAKEACENAPEVYGKIHNIDIKEKEITNNWD